MISSNANRVGYKDYENFSDEMNRELEALRLKRQQTYKEEKRKKQRESSLVIQIAVAIALAVVLLLSTLATRSSLVEAYNDLYAVQNTYQTTQNEFQRLSLELSRAKALDKIDVVAREKLGMVTPDRFSTIVVSSVKHADAGTLNSNDSVTASKGGILPTVLAFFYPIVERLASSVTAGWMVGAADPLPTVLE